jgi:hypothetical protein
MLKNTAVPLVMVTFNTAGLVAGYQSVNPLGFEGWPFYLLFYNASNAVVTVSYDGVNPAFIMPATSTREINFQTNASPSGWQCLIPKGSQIYVSGAAGVGNFYVSGYYQQEQN